MFNYRVGIIILRCENSTPQSLEKMSAYTYKKKHLQDQRSISVAQVAWFARLFANVAWSIKSRECLPSHADVFKEPLINREISELSHWFYSSFTCLFSRDFPSPQQLLFVIPILWRSGQEKRPNFMQPRQHFSHLEETALKQGARYNSKLDNGFWSLFFEEGAISGKIVQTSWTSD